jgi:FixJ family two-component response regulator
MSSEKQVVHIVDDDEAMRVGLARLLGAAGYATRCYASAGDFLVTEPVDRFGCMVLDLHLPGPDGLSLQQVLQRDGDAMPIVFLSGRGDIGSSVRALKAGASDFLTKPVQGEVLLEAVRRALADAAPRRAALERQRDHAQRYATLSERERSVLHAVVQGRLTKQIADELGLSERTVKACRADVMLKLGVVTLPELVRLDAGLAPLRRRSAVALPRGAIAAARNPDAPASHRL